MSEGICSCHFKVRHAQVFSWLVSLWCGAVLSRVADQDVSGGVLPSLLTWWLASCYVQTLKDLSIQKAMTNVDPQGL